MPPGNIERGINLLRTFPSFSQAGLFMFMDRLGSGIEKKFELPYDVSKCHDGMGLNLYVLTADEAISVGLGLPENYIRLNKELDSLRERWGRLIYPGDSNEAGWYKYVNDLELLGYKIGKRKKEIALSSPEFMDEIMEIIEDVSTDGYDNAEKAKQISTFNNTNALIGWVGIRSLREKDEVTKKAYKLSEKVKKHREQLLAVY